MSRDSSPGLNFLVRNWTKNVPKTTSSLKNQGYSYQLLHRYEQSGWIVSIGKGAYARAGDTVSWAGALHALQNEMDLPIRLGGISALSHAGYGRYLQARDRVHLFGVNRKSLPRWFLPLAEKHGLVIEPAGQLGDVAKMDLKELAFGDFSILGSPPELAYVEILTQVPGRIAFREAAEVAEGLNALRSKRLQSVLEASQSVKANRLALYFGDLYSHPWRFKILDEKVELGSGKRTIVPGGKLNAKYQIVVPGENGVL